jgi:hypothetical protein
MFPDLCALVVGEEEYLLPLPRIELRFFGHQVHNLDTIPSGLSNLLFVLSLCAEFMCNSVALQLHESRFDFTAFDSVSVLEALDNMVPGRLVTTPANSIIF